MTDAMTANDLPWRKSTRSADNGGQCVELAIWRKSSRSGDNGGECVEIAALPLDTGHDDRSGKAAIPDAR